MTEGRPAQWPSTLFTAEHGGSVECLVFSPDEKTFACISEESVYICDSETGHLISGSFDLEHHSEFEYACFSPNGTHILVRYYNSAIVLDIERGEEQFRIGGRDFVFIQCGRWCGRIASMDEDEDDDDDDDEDEDGSSIQTRLTRIRVKLWDVENGTPKSITLFEVTDVDAGVTRFSPDGQFLAIERRSEGAIELWNVEDGKNTRRFPYPPGYLSSLHFSPTSDILMAVFWKPEYICVWRLDTQEMTSFSVNTRHITPVVIRAPLTSHLFIPRDDTVEIWEVSMTSSHMIFETKLPITSEITNICPSCDGNKILVGSGDGTVRMWDMNLARNQAVTMDTQDDVREVIAVSPSRNMVATQSTRSVEFWDTTTWEVVRRMDTESRVKIAFSPDENQVAVLSKSLLTLWDINNPENRLSFDPWPSGRYVRNWQVAFQTSDHVVVCARLWRGPSLLQVWHVTGPTRLFSLDIEISSFLFLAPDGLTVISKYGSYSWSHDTAQFDPFHFTSQGHLSGCVYSPDRKLIACCSPKDDGVRVRDTRMGQLCGKPITTSNYVDSMALSPALNHQSLGNRLIAIHCRDTTSLFDVDTGHLYTEFWSQGRDMAFIHDGTKLMTSANPLIIRDTADLIVKHRDGYKLHPRDLKDGWMIGQDNESLFWVPLEHRENLCLLPQFEMTWGRSTKLNLYNFRYGDKWTECIDQEWLKELEDKEKKMGRLLG